MTKTIGGPAAGQQGEVTIHTECNGTALTPDLVIPAGAPAGDRSHIYSNIPTPANCVATETNDGATSTLSALVEGSGQTVSVPAGGAGAAHVSDTYSRPSGSLLVTKTIAGPLAGRQGRIVIHTVCNGTARSPDFVIAARTRAGRVSHSFDGIPAGSVCTVTETADGATAAVTATVSGAGQRVTVPARKVVAVNLVDVYRDTPGSLKVTKTIAGPAARRHGHIAIVVDCGGALNDFDFLIPARTAVGSVSRSFDGLPAGSRCTVTETEVGRTDRVAVVAIGDRKKVTIHANRTAAAHLTDIFNHRAPVTG